ncbi:MAG TPA: nitroreductase family protein [Gemmatimonadales bacterium]|nr:nitroreductase family protein [Gemmatimonadales bacterium]
MARQYRREMVELIGQGNFSLPWPLAQAGRAAFSSESLARRVERSELISVRSSPLLALISAPGDDHRAHLRSGQVLERIWLAATAHGLGLQPASAALAVPETRAGLARAFGLRDGLVPQELIRIGEPSRHRSHLTPRRPAEVLVGD